MKKIIPIIIVCLMTLTFPAYCEEEGGPPKPDQIIGYWKLLEWPNPNMQKVNPWPMPHQWFAIYEDGRFLSMMNSEDADHSAKNLEEIFSVFNSNPPTYKWINEVMIVMENPNIPDYAEAWGNEFIY